MVENQRSCKTNVVSKPNDMSFMQQIDYDQKFKFVSNFSSN